MALKDCLDLIKKGLDSADREAMLMRSKELQKEGMSKEQADRAALNEFKAEIDADMSSLKKQLGIKQPSKKEIEKQKAAIRESQVAELQKQYDEQISALDAEEKGLIEKQQKDAGKSKEQTVPPVQKTGTEGQGAEQRSVRDTKQDRKPDEAKPREKDEKAEVRKISDSVSEKLKVKEKDAKDKIAEGLSELASAMGAKKELTGEQRNSGEKALKKIAEALVELGGVKLSQLRNSLGEYLKGMNISVPDDLFNKVVRDYKESRRKVGVQERKLMIKEVGKEVTQKVSKAKEETLLQETQARIDEARAKIDKQIETIDKQGVSVDYGPRGASAKRYMVKKDADGNYSVSSMHDRGKKGAPVRVGNKQLRKAILDKYRRQRKKDIEEIIEREYRPEEERLLDELEERIISEVEAYEAQREKPLPEKKEVPDKVQEPVQKTEPSEGKRLTITLPSRGKKIQVDEMVSYIQSLKTFEKGATAGKKAMNQVKADLVDVINETMKLGKVDSATRGEVRQLMNKVKRIKESNAGKVIDEATSLVERIREKQQMAAAEQQISKLLKTRTTKTEKGKVKGTAPHELKSYLEQAGRLLSQAKSEMKNAKISQASFTTGLKGEEFKAAKRQHEQAQRESYDDARLRFDEYKTMELERAQRKQDSKDPILVEQGIYEEIAIRDLERAFGADAKDMTGIAEAMSFTVSQGKKEFKDRVMQEIQRRKDIREFSEEATSNQWSGKDNLKVQSQKIQQKWGNTKNFFQSKGATAKEIFIKPVTTSFEYILKNIESLKYKMQEGPIYNYFFKDANTGWMASNENYKKRIRQTHEDLVKIVRTATGKKKTGWTMAGWADNVKKTGIFLLDAEGTREVIETSMSKGTAANIYAISRMAEGRRKLLESGFDETALRQVESFMGPELKQVVDNVSKMLKEKHKEYSQRHLDVNLTPLEYVENYHPLFYQSSKSISRDARVETGADSFTLPSIDPRHIRHRIKNSSPLDLTGNYFDIVWKYFDSMELFHNFGRFTKDFNALLSDPVVRQNIKNKDPRGFKQLVDATNRAIYNEKGNVADVERVVHHINRATAFAKIAIRTWTALKQMLSVPAYFEYAQEAKIDVAGKSIYVPLVGTGRFVSDMLFQMNPVNAIRNHKFFMKNSTYYKERIKRGNVGDEEIGRGFTNLSRVGAARPEYILRKGEETIGKVGIFANKMVDAYTIASGGKALYNQNFKKYLKIMPKEAAHRKAIRDFELAFNQSQQSSERAFLGEAQGKKGIVKSLFATFKNAQFSYLRKFMEGQTDLINGYARERARWEKIYSSRNDKNAEMKARARALKYITSKGGRGDLRKMAIYGYVLPVAWQYVLSGMPGVLTDWDDDDSAEMNRALYLGPADYLFIGGDMIKAGYNKIFLGKFFQDYEPSQLVTTIDDAFDDIAKAYSDEGEFNVNVMAEILRQVIMTTGLDIENLDLIYEGAEDMIMNGEWTQENIMKLLAAPKSIREGKSETKKSSSFVDLEGVDSDLDIPELDFEMPDLD